MARLCDSTCINTGDQSESHDALPPHHLLVADTGNDTSIEAAWPAITHLQRCTRNQEGSNHSTQHGTKNLQGHIDYRVQHWKETANCHANGHSRIQMSTRNVGSSVNPNCQSHGIDPRFHPLLGTASQNLEEHDPNELNDQRNSKLPREDRLVVGEDAVSIHRIPTHGCLILKEPLKGLACWMQNAADSTLSWSDHDDYRSCQLLDTGLTQK